MNLPFNHMSKPRSDSFTEFTWQLRFCVKCLGMAIASSPLTSTRFSVGIGPTDIFLVLSLVATLVMLRLSPAVSNESRIYRLGNIPLYRFWIFTLPLLIVSTLLNAAFSGSSFAPYLTQLIPYFPAALLVFSMHAIASRPHLLDLIVKNFMFASFAIGIIYLLLILTHQSAYYLDDVRFQGFSDNANQVADEAFSTILVCLIYPILFPNLNSKMRYFVYSTAALAVIYGAACDAATFFIALIFVGGLYGAYLFLLNIRTRPTITALAFIAVIAVALFNQAAIVDFTMAFMDSARIHKERGDEDLIRYILWDNGIIAGLASPIIGNGAGAWSGLQGAFGATEAHNSFIDWFSIVGLVGLAIWLFEIGAIIIRFRWNNPAPHIFFVALLIFSTFHFVFRHPFFWFAACLCAMATRMPLYFKKKVSTQRPLFVMKHRI